MQNELKRIFEQGRELWQKLPPRRRYVILGAVAGVLLLGAVLALRPASEEYTVLSAGLPTDDTARIVEHLKAQNIRYRVGANNTIEVPAAQAHDARLGLALNNVALGGGAGFELFDKQGFGKTSFEQQVDYQRAIQGELERTLRLLEPVQKARVHIARPEHSLFTDDDRQATASVTLTLKKRLTPAQVRGIVHVVAGSVEGLSPDRVTVVDDTGAVLSSGGGEDSAAESQQELERTLARRVVTMVDPIVGVGHSQVVVTAEIDQSQRTTTDERWDKDKIALRSEQNSDEKSTGPSQPAQGVAGAQGNLPTGQGNLPGAPAPAAAAGGSGGSSQKTAQTRNYEINHIVERIIGPKAQLKRLHVAVLVDHGPKAGAPGERVPRDAQVLEQIEKLARAAAGLEATRGDTIQVVTARFVGDGSGEEQGAGGKGPLSRPLVWAAMAAPALVLVLVLAFVLRSRRRRATEEQALPMLPATVDELERTLPAAEEPPPHLVAPAARDRVTQLVRDDTARAAEVLQAWLLEQPNKQEGEHHREAKAS